MSLRPQLRGFNLEKMQSFFGSGDDQVVAAVEKILAPLWREYAEDDEDEAAEPQRCQMEIVRRAVKSGIPFADLVQETEDHYDVARAFADVRQKPVITKICEWGSATFPDFLKRYGHAMEEERRKYFSYFVEGRPLFGTQADGSYGPYSFLSRAEAATLAAGLRQAQRKEKDLAGTSYADGFVDAMIEVLERLQRDNLHVWFFFH